MAKISPALNGTQFDDSGNLLNGGLIYTYAANSSTPQTTYTSSSGLTAQQNPVVLDARGEADPPIWLAEGISYKLRLFDNQVVPQFVREFDYITGVGDNFIALDQWVPSGVTPTYLSPNSFSVPGDQTSSFLVNRRVKLTETAGTVYGYISVSVFTTLTTVTVVLDSGVLDTGLSSVQLGLITPTNTSLPSIPNSIYPANIRDDAIIARTLDDSAQGFSMINGTIVIPAPVAGALTIQIKTKAGTDPSAADPVLIHFRDQALTGGSYTIISLTAATSFVISSGSTIGAVSAVPARFWLVGFNDGGTFRLGVINLSTSVTIGDDITASSTAEGGAGGADSAGIYYTTVAVSNKPMRVLGYIENTQATAGTYVTAPSKIQMVSGIYATNVNPALTLSTAQNTIAGTSIDFTGIPISAKRATLMFSNLSTNGISPIIIYMGDAGGPETSGYLGCITSNSAVAVAGSANLSSGVLIFANANVGTYVYHGYIQFDLLDPITQTWAFNGIVSRSDNNVTSMVAGTKVLSPGPLSQLRITTAGGVDTVDLGIANVSFE